MSNGQNMFKDFLKQRDLKWTPERRAIFNEVCRMQCHFEADELLFKLRQHKSKVSKGSVYRTIRLLETAGIIRPVVFTERHTHYERVAGRKHHSHLICLKCGKIIEFFKPKLAEGLKEVYKEYDFEEMDHKIETTGFCRRCRKRI